MCFAFCPIGCIELYCIVVHFQNPPTELLPHLYIGDERHSSNIELLQRTGITTILNVSNSNPVPECSQFAYKQIPIRDNESENISSWFNEALQFIGKQTICNVFKT